MKTETKCIHGSYVPGNGEPRHFPIVQSTTWRYSTSDEMGKLFDLEKDGYFYTRLANPTNDTVAKKICALEGGIGATLTSSGQAANFFAVFNICESGDHFVSTTSIYGGTFNLFAVTMKKMGIECTFVDQDASDEEIQKAFRPNTKCFFGETISNPGVKILDISRLANIAHKNGVPFIIDNTFPTPINCRPFEFGADIVTHSTTKYLDGHGTQTGGIVIDSGNFDFAKYGDKFPGLNKPDDSYHGIIYTEKFGKMGYIVKTVSQLMRDLGSIPSPQNAFYLSLSVESVHVRVPRHCENAQRVAEYLSNRKEVAWVKYPGLKTDKYYNLAQKYCPNGTCGVLCFGLKGDRATTEKFMDALKLIGIYTHVADSSSCVLHPASHTHRQLSDEQLILSGIDPSLIRFSVGTENIEDILGDLDQAFEALK